MREKSSTGPLAEGFSMPLIFAWEAALLECPVKSKYPLNAIRLVRAVTGPRRILVWNRWRFLGYFWQLPHDVGGGQTGDSARSGSGGGFGRGFGAGAGGPGTARMGAVAAARGGGRGERSGRTAAACAGGIARRARALRGAARRRRNQRVRTRSGGPAAHSLGGIRRAHMGTRAGHAAHATAAGLSRGYSKRGREPCVHALHRDAGARVYGPAPGTRRTRGGDCGQPVRRTFGAQLGMRRFPRSEERDRLGGGRTGGEFRGAQSAACDPQPAPVQHQPLSAEL